MYSMKSASKQETLTLEFRISNYINSSLIYFNRFFDDAEGFNKLKKMNSSTKTRLVKLITRKILKEKKIVHLEKYVELNSNYFDDNQYEEVIYSHDKSALILIKDHFNDFVYKEYFGNFRLSKKFNIEDEIICFVSINEDRDIEYVKVKNYKDMLIDSLLEIDNYF